MKQARSRKNIVLIASVHTLHRRQKTALLINRVNTFLHDGNLNFVNRVHIWPK